MADFLFGLRRMMGLTSPQEEADQAERERALQEQASRFNPGVALRNRQDALDQLIPQATGGVRNVSVQPAQAAPQPPPASAPAAPSPARPFNPNEAMDALNFQQGGVRSSINAVIPERRPDDEDRRLRNRAAQGGVRG